MRRSSSRMLMSSRLLCPAANKAVIGYGRARLRMGFVGVVDVEPLEEMVVIHRWRLSSVIRRARVQQQVIIATGWMRPGRPPAGHATAGEADTLTDCNSDAPEALIGTGLAGETRAVESAGDTQVREVGRQ